MAPTKSQLDRIAKIKALKAHECGIITSALTETKWDDAMFRDRFLVHGLLNTTKRGDVSSAFKTALGFWGWYLGIDIPQDSKGFIEAYYTILGAINFQEDHLLPAGDKDPLKIRPPGKFEINSYVFMGCAQNHVTSETKTCSVDDVKKFCTYLEALKGSTDAVMMDFVIKLTGFIMLNLLRLGPKSPEEVTTHIVRRATDTFTSLVSEVECKIPPPCQAYYELHSLHLSEAGRPIKYLRSVLVWEFRTLTSDVVKGMYKAGIMLSLADNGLGLISWPNKAATTLRVDLGTFLTYCLFDDNFLDQATKLTQFLEENKYEKTWPFCRLFDSSAHASMSTSNNPDICILSALIEMKDKNLVNNLQQFKSIANMVDGLVPFAEGVKQALRHERAKTAISDEAHKSLLHVSLRKRGNTSLRQNQAGVSYNVSPLSGNIPENDSHNDTEDGNEEEADYN